MFRIISLSTAVLVLLVLATSVSSSTEKEIFSWEETDLEKVVTVESDNYIYSIPVKYLDGIGRNSTNNRLSSISLIALFPNFEGRNMENKSIFTSHKGMGDKIKIMLNHGQRMKTTSETIVEEINMQNNLYKKEKPDGETHGLLYYKNPNKEIYYLNDYSHKIICYVSDKKTITHYPSCDVHTDYNKDFYLWYRFSKNYLPSWQEIDNGVRMFISKMEKSKK